MSYSVKEIYYTLQGEGLHSGRPAVFLRFSGCNLWSGREADRATAICDFCDTDFVGVDGVGGGKYHSAEALAEAAFAVWQTAAEPGLTPPFVVCTGGEPLLQLTPRLVRALASRDFVIAVETNGTIEPPRGVDWVCCSPKQPVDALKLRSGDELKFVFPHRTLDPAQYLSLDFEHFFIQPMDGPAIDENRQLAIDYCRDHPRWKLSLQTHKALGIR